MSKTETIMIEVTRDRRLCSKEASKYIGISHWTLSRHRHEKGWPSFVKIGGKIFYYVKDLDDWLNNREKIVPNEAKKIKEDM